MTGNRYEDGMSSLQSSMEDDHDFNKYANGGLSNTLKLLGSQASNLHPHPRNRLGTTGFKKIPSMRIN